jgi:3-deoxy-manno-octulosonate cytidylyltransferase (CMP-KDO synthetase)
MMNVVAIIPARYGSTRFPGKPLALIDGIPMIERVVRRVESAGVVDRVVVATDDRRIEELVHGFGGEVVMTSAGCVNGTERCVEAMGKLTPRPDAIINVQGDEPFVHPEQLEELVRLINLPNATIATLARPMKASDKGREDKNRVKVVRNLEGCAIHFSRTPVPNSSGPWLQHVGLYAYTSSALEDIVKLDATELEKRELLEQLRWLDHGWSISLGLTNHKTPAVDTPEDLEKIKVLLQGGEIL